MKRGNHSKARGSKALVIVLALVLLVGATIGGTIAWLTDVTDPVVNTFTVGNIDIELTEDDTTPDNTDDANANSYKMIPGHTIAKNPTVTVVDGSEDCWLFVKLEEAIAPQTTDNSFDKTFDDYITYSVAAGWTALPGHDGVYYRSVMADATEKVFPVLTDNQVTVKPGVTKTMMDNLTNAGKNPTLTVTAYACQYYSGTNSDGTQQPFTVDVAWHTVNGDSHS